MKNRYILLLVFTFALFSCDDKDDLFDIDVQQDLISFTAVPGGAVMNYSIPKNSGVSYIQAMYKDFENTEITLYGTYLDDSIKLTGFVHANDNVPIEISYLDKYKKISRSFNTSFKVLKSSAAQVFDDLEVTSYWNGFALKYLAPERSTGFIHVGKIGVNPYTNAMDTLLIKSSEIKDGEVTMYFSNVTEGEYTDVVIWTEDDLNNKVSRKVFNEVPAAKSELIVPSTFEFTGSSEEQPEHKIGQEYLFDGDKNGVNKLELGSYRAYNDQHDYTFYSEQNSVPGFWFIDLKEATEVAGIRFYTEYKIEPTNDDVFMYYKSIDGGEDARNLKGFDNPSSIVIYGSNDEAAPIEEWKELGAFSESRAGEAKDRWNYKGINMWGAPYYVDVNVVEQLEPISLNVDFQITGNTYRYLYINVLDTYEHVFLQGSLEYHTKLPLHDGKRIQLSELEVYKKK